MDRWRARVKAQLDAKLKTQLDEVHHARSPALVLTDPRTTTGTKYST